MTDITFDQLLEFRNAAQAEMIAATESMRALAEQLKTGVSYKEGCEIANRFWSVRQAAEIKLCLFDSFPAENGQVILGKGLDKQISGQITTDLTKAYFTAAGVYIRDYVQAILDDVNSKGLVSEDAIHTLNRLKAEVSRYLSFINWGVYEIKAQLLDASPKGWQDLSPSVESVESGDYLFLENIPALVDAAHAKFAEENFPQQYSVSLGDVDWRYGTLDAVMELSLLFASYLRNFIDEASKREVD